MLISLLEVNADASGASSAAEEEEEEEGRAETRLRVVDARDRCFTVGGEDTCA